MNKIGIISEVMHVPLVQTKSEFTSMYDTVKFILLRYASLCTTQFNMKINERFFETRVIATGEKSLSQRKVLK